VIGKSSLKVAYREKSSEAERDFGYNLSEVHLLAPMVNK
jgi:hypothetical protein